MTKALLHFWHQSYHYFTFQQFSMVPTIENYAKLLNSKNANENKVYCYKLELVLKRKLSKHGDSSERVGKIYEEQGS